MSRVFLTAVRTCVRVVPFTQTTRNQWAHYLGGGREIDVGELNSVLIEDVISVGLVEFRTVTVRRLTSVFESYHLYVRKGIGDGISPSVLSFCLDTACCFYAPT